MARAAAKSAKLDAVDDHITVVKGEKAKEPVQVRPGPR